MSYDSRIIVYAKPSATDVFPYNLYIVNPILSAKQEKQIVITGKSFYQIQNVFLSSSDTSILQNLNFSYYNPFSAIKNLSALNPSFDASLISQFDVPGEKFMVLDLPDALIYHLQTKPIGYTTYFDILIQNEAGYGQLSRDSYSYSVSSWRGFVQTQKPCISGIKVEIV
jgi:hypothetical protein